MRSVVPRRAVPGVAMRGPRVVFGRDLAVAPPTQDHHCCRGTTTRCRQGGKGTGPVQVRYPVC
jgi:hypothetical protein